MNITGKIRIFKHESGYSGSIAYKKINEYETLSYYVNVDFMKGISLENKTDINVKNGWLNVSKSKEGDKYLILFVKEFEVVKNDKE